MTRMIFLTRLSSLKPHRAAKRRAVTLVETVLAMMIGLIVIGTVTGAIQTMTIHGDRLQRVEAARSDMLLALNRMRSELRLATALDAFSPTSVTFTHPDVTGDALADTIEYAWSGTPGDPMIRTVAGDKEVILIASVYDWAFSFVGDFSADEGSDADVESDEILFFAVNDAPQRSSAPVSTLASVGQYFKPTLPDDATQWRVTRVFVSVHPDGSSPGLIQLSLYRSNGSGPVGAALATANITPGDTTAGLYTWVEKRLSSAPWLDPTVGAFVALGQRTLLENANIQIQGNNPQPDALSLYTGVTVTAVTVWTAQPSKSMWIYVYGSYISEDPDGTNYSGTVGAVRMHGAFDVSGHEYRMESAADCLNRPRVSGAVAESGLEL